MISLRPDAPTAEYLLAGNGALGQFDLRAVSVSIPAPQPPSTCSGPNKVYGSAVAGGGVFRFADGSLLNVYLTGEAIASISLPGRPSVPGFFKSLVEPAVSGMRPEAPLR